MASDRANQVVNLTGAGERWLDRIDFTSLGPITTPRGWDGRASACSKTCSAVELPPHDGTRAVRPASSEDDQRIVGPSIPAGDRDGRAVAVCITRRPRAGRDRESEEFLGGTIAAGSRFSAYLGVRVSRPVRGNQRHPRRRRRFIKTTRPR